MAGYVSIKKSSANAGAAQPKDNGAFALSPEAAKETKTLLTTDDMTALRDKLRALGLPNATVREIVQARITSQNTPRLREIGNAALEAARQRPYWQGKRTRTLGGDAYTPEQQKERQDIFRGQQLEMRQLFGVDAIADNYALVQYAGLPPEKAVQMQDVERDYSDLRDQAINEMAGFKMPGDEAKLKLIDDEKKRDMLALLTPEEKEVSSGFLVADRGKVWCEV